MVYRSFLHVPAGRIVDRVDGSADATFGSSDATALAEVAGASGLPLAELEVVVSDARPDVSNAIVMTPGDPGPPRGREKARIAIEAATGFAELRTALLDWLDEGG